MPKRTDLRSILLIGSGPIIIGQACEFDYSGTQACKALKEEGYRVVLVNSNPATIMTDPGFADRTYIEPLTVEILEKIIAQERPDALLPTIGGQTGLNLAIDLAEQGVLDRYGVELIGAKLPAIKKAEDRNLFKAAMEKIGLDLPRSGYARSLQEAEAIRQQIGLPLIIRPSRTLGGTGGGIVTSLAEFQTLVEWGLDASPTHEVLIEESIAGWKEFELEVMRDGKDNVVIICSIENFDPMGVHTGDSITVAPAQTLTDKEYQIMRDAALRIIREIGVDTGGSNIQFAVDPDTGRMVVIEMNPRVSRSSALASKATGFPIAKIAAKLAIGYTLDEIRNDITRETPACFEPTIDYVVVKIPRFTFDKFPQTTDTLGPQMKSVGEAMAIGRTFKEALQKALRSLEIGSFGFEEKVSSFKFQVSSSEEVSETIRERLCTPNAERLWYVADALRMGISIEELYQLTKIDPWFLENIAQIVRFEETALTPNSELRTPNLLREAKRMGFSDVRLARLLGCSEAEVRERREQWSIVPVYKTVDTCAAEFVAHTPYLYSTYEGEDEAQPTARRKIVILGGGPNRIGQGIEFDYCCVHAAFALKEDGFETIMVNCNPETVSTDYDTSDKLYFEPLTLEDVLSIVREERPFGVIVQFGGQTPLKLAVPLERASVRILGTSPDSIDRAEDRERFKEVLDRLGLLQPPSGTSRSPEEALRIAREIGYPVLMRPSYVLGGRAMQIVYDEASLRRYMREAVSASPEHPVLIDKFLDDATEVDVDAVSDGQEVVIGGIMEHIELAGVHSGDSACSLPPRSLSPAVQNEIRRQTVLLAKELQVVGLMNVQFAVKAETVYVLEVNPRASRTVPFVSKAIGVPLAKLAARVMAGKTLRDLGFTREIIPSHISVKEAVFPFIKFPGVDTILGPEMKSTGEVMGVDTSFALAFAKAEIAAGTLLPVGGTAFLSVRDYDKAATLPIARRLVENGFTLMATRGTAAYLRGAGIEVETVNKVAEGSPHVVDAIRAGKIALVINTIDSAQSVADSFSIRRSALECRVPYCTTVAGAGATAEGIAHLRRGLLNVRPLQEYHQESDQLSAISDQPKQGLSKQRIH
ncbi:MAG: carbamoyl-phosphate synthase large subunit [Deltaproteobacteria bacterium]|nr:carbamoyl-phosphate synthase large subunit [Deltaproteobacteria bacterium]